MLGKSPEAIKNHLDNILDSRVEFEISDVLKSGFQLFKKAASKYIFFVFVLLLIYLLTAAIPLGPAVLNLYILPALIIGSMIFSHEVTTNSEAEFGSFFSGFKYCKEFLPANVFIFVLLTLVSFILVNDVQHLQEIAANGEASIDDLQIAFQNIPSFKLGIAIGGMLLIQFFSFYTNYFIGIYKLDTIDSLKYSALFMLKKGGIVLVFHILMLCLLFSSLFLFIIGVFLVAAIMVPIYYVSFLELTGYENLIKNENGIDQINQDIW